MTRRMLINAQVPEELRIAVVADSTLEEYQVEVAEHGLTRGNIYRGTIANVQPSLNAAFIDFGAERHGFLPIQDVVPEAYYRKPNKDGRARIEDVLERGKPIVVQVNREPEGNKGAALTTNISIAGRYLVLTPFDSTRGISRKVEDEETRKALRTHINSLELPPGCGLIVRTNAIDQNKTALRRDLSALLRVWKKVGTAARQGKGTRLLYSDQNLILQALRDYLTSSIGEVLVDSDEAYAKAEEYMKAFMPRSKTQLVRYTERAPLFSKFNLELQIEKIYQRRVDLPGGGSIVIDPTEALTAIDVNSGRSTSASSQAETALNTNLEAAVEVARQLRLRDIGGLMVVDFIDMRNMRHRRKLEKALRDAMKADKARHTIGRISGNGLLEINRQRIQQALHIRTHQACPTCEGTGRVPSPEMVALGLIRRIEARAAGGRLAKARVRLHPALADDFQNARRRQLAELETEFDMVIEVISDPLLHRPEQEIEWTTRDPRKARPRTPRVIKAKVDASALVEPILGGTSADDSAGHSAGHSAGQTADLTENEATRGRSRRRRGRRGGRGRRRSPEPEVVELEAGAEDAPAESHELPFSAQRPSEVSAEPTASVSEDDEAATDARPTSRRRRSRGGRGRRRSTPEAATASPDGQDGTPSDVPPSPEGGPEMVLNEDGDVMLPKRPRRKRRSRTPVESRDPSEATAADEPAEAKGDSSEDQGEARPRTRRTRSGASRRGSRGRGNLKSEESQEATSAGQAGGPTEVPPPVAEAPASEEAASPPPFDINDPFVTLL